MTFGAFFNKKGGIFKVLGNKNKKYLVNKFTYADDCAVIRLISFICAACSVFPFLSELESFSVFSGTLLIDVFLSIAWPLIKSFLLIESMAVFLKK